VVENLQFQASPGLYCTANLYIPKDLPTPAPTVLYRCGHWKMVTNGVSLGNKAVYQIDGAWFARNGYICLVLDTLLAGEIQGIHTGTRDHGLWWWNSRGYTPAGVEAWFGIRALDYLSSRPEVDRNRFGVTGHSGGGAYSWTLAALDDRVTAVAPLAGMTDLQHHILGNLMDSHCDCNFWINTRRWDFPQLAALIAPRPLLMGGTDADGIFPLDGTVSIHARMERIYRLLGADKNLGLIIAPGPHDEVPELRLAVLRWFNRHLKGIEKPTEPAIMVEARPWCAPEQLRVFDQLPSDAINSNIADTFVPMAAPQFRSARALRIALLDGPFAGWPTTAERPDPIRVFAVDRGGFRLSAWDFLSQPNVPLRLYFLERPTDTPSETIDLRVLDEPMWLEWLDAVGALFGDQLTEERAGLDSITPDAVEAGRLSEMMAGEPGPWAFVAPRGVGLTAWSGDAKRSTRIRRRFMLLGQTVDGMRVWDIRRAVQALRSIPPANSLRVELQAGDEMAVNALYAALFEPDIRELHLEGLSDSQIAGPDYLGVLKVTDLPEVRAAVPALGVVSPTR